MTSGMDLKVLRVKACVTQRAVALILGMSGCRLCTLEGRQQVGDDFTQRYLRAVRQTKREQATEKRIAARMRPMFAKLRTFMAQQAEAS